MMKTILTARFRSILVLSMALMLSLVTIWTLELLDQERPASLRAEELQYLPNGSYLRVAVLGYRQIAADLIWLKVVQHFGERYQTAVGYKWAYHAADVVTDLDPEFVMAYQAAGTVLAVWGGQIQESIAILAKGMQHNPDVWRLPFLIGYDYFYELCDSVKAGEYFRAASFMAGAPEYLPKLAARMTVEGGDPDAALEFLAKFSQQTKDERLLETLDERMREVVAERDIRILQNAIRQYQERFDHMPKDLEDLVVIGVLTEIPLSPLGGRYVLNPSDGSVSTPDLPERLRVHRHESCQTVSNKRTASQQGRTLP